MLRTYLSVIPILLLLIALLSLWLYPAAAPVLSLASLLSSLALAIHRIFERHRGAKDARLKIAGETLLLTLILVWTIALGGLAGMFAYSHVSLRYGATMGWLSAIAASFLAGYVMQGGMAVWKR
jgi:hypothetical protein